MFDSGIESIKVFFSGIIAGGVTLMGASFKYIGILVILMMVDTLFGWIKAKKSNNWNSSSARWGFIGKIIELMFIGVLCLLDIAFDTGFLEYAGIFYFGACELASIVENYAEINKNLPEGTLDLIKKLKFSVGTAVMQRLKNVFDTSSRNEKGDNENE